MVNITCIDRTTDSWQSANRHVLGRYEQKVARGKGANDCWLWQGSKSGSNLPHGDFHVGMVDGRAHKVKAHRFAWEQANQRSVPDGMCVLHRCDVPLCVNPSHLFIGTQADNLADARQKGRLDESRPRTRKLTPEQREDIYRRAHAGSRGIQSQLAEEFGVTKTAISLIASGRFTATTARRQAA